MSAFRHLQAAFARVMGIAFLAVLVSLSMPGGAEVPSDLAYSSEMQYSPLGQITSANVSRLARCWTYHTGEKGRQFETTPVFAGGLLYISSQSASVIALE